MLHTAVPRIVKSVCHGGYLLHSNYDTNTAAPSFCAKLETVFSMPKILLFHYIDSRSKTEYISVPRRPPRQSTTTFTTDIRAMLRSCHRSPGYHKLSFAAQVQDFIEVSPILLNFYSCSVSLLFSWAQNKIVPVNRDLIGTSCRAIRCGHRTQCPITHRRM